MAEILVGIPLFAAAGFFQISIFGRIRLMNGCTDLILLFLIAWSTNDRTKYSWILMIWGGLIMSYISAVPMHGYLWMYALIWLLIRFIKLRVWNMPLILMLFVTIIGTLVISAGTIGLLYLQNANLDISAAFRQIIIPSLVMNLLFSVPIYAFLNDVVNTIYINEEAE